MCKGEKGKGPCHNTVRLLSACSLARHRERYSSACRMGMTWQRMALLLLLLLLLLLPPRASAAAAADTSRCEALITTLVPCLAYVQGQGPLPSHDCCANVLPIHQKEPQCLCELIVAASQHNPQLPTLNLTLALSLGPACNIATRPSLCPQLLGFAPGSPEAKIFPSAPTSPSAPDGMVTPGPHATSPPSSATPATPATTSTATLAEASSGHSCGSRAISAILLPGLLLHLVRL